ncbi:Polynucleotide adenylyltransferase region [Candidatus Ruthia magnifica str. Cm (Calyptogena magnifica)]|uniref:Polynucleotide adenylyltransferase region n=1 Tax=Ruthia magnifica subsp. Calyptogena magnifica TaxID=413404 RepID=A1AVM9_RUTMC|nr:polynucleotide adenylyltransferase [Candidatus Ruthturnera calyptogenae]ABL01986.1 Polynucleotide adenylyltransferase region [Candidatus Ruthia magnifica str. Cm (Calyptogena magnifica)]
MKVYLVGGAVRDQLLGIADEFTEKDWMVVGSSSKQMLDLGYRQVGKNFPVFLHPGTQEEYALARLERKIGTGYKGFKFDISSQVTLEQDLFRRDLTINAMAQKAGELFDPFNGQEDLNNGILRHVSNAFSEDPVRILRIARFAARFKKFGFKVAHQTHQLMSQMVTSGEVDALTPERVFKELNKALSYETPSAFFKVLTACGAYQKVFSSLDNQVHQNHSNSFVFLDNLNTDKAHIKFSIWLKDENRHNIKALCNIIKCPKQYQQLSELVSQFYQFSQDFTNHSSNEVFDFFAKTDILRHKDRFEDLLSTFKLLEIDIVPIEHLRDLLKDINISKLDKSDIAKAIQIEKRLIIDLFFKTVKK